jgi:hypothetical protein
VCWAEYFSGLPLAYFLLRFLLPCDAGRQPKAIFLIDFNTNRREIPYTTPWHWCARLMIAHRAEKFPEEGA